MKLALYNTLTRKKEAFTPLKERVTFYACGPTVYDFAHVGNLRTYIFEDVLKRTLKLNGYKVTHVVNITDVGHLTSDADEGEDKMIKALKREGKELNEESMLEIAEKYTSAFKKDLSLLNIEEPDIWCKATEHIKEQISLAKKIEENGYAYETDQALYFDTQKLEGYKDLARLDMEGLREGASVEAKKDKKSPTDFALWIKATGEHANHIMNWDSPWGKGFPGWHIECSAMSTKYLGEKFDIHTGGVDHIPVHHTNERAQNIAAFGHPVVRFWIHGEFLILKEGRMGKSEGNTVLVKDITEKGFDPLTYRYLALNAHYRSKLTFSWEALRGAQNSLDNLYEKVRDLKKEESKASSNRRYKKEFLKIVNDDLNTPEALALAWKLLKDENLNSGEKLSTLLYFDRVLGLKLSEVEPLKSELIKVKTQTVKLVSPQPLVVTSELKGLIKKREKFRKEKKFKEADRIRKKIRKMGYQLEDTEKGPKIKQL